METKERGGNDLIQKIMQRANCSIELATNFLKSSQNVEEAIAKIEEHNRALAHVRNWYHATRAERASLELERFLNRSPEEKKAEYDIQIIMKKAGCCMEIAQAALKAQPNLDEAIARAKEIESDRLEQLEAFRAKYLKRSD